CSLMPRRHTTPTLVPYTTLFRSIPNGSKYVIISIRASSIANAKLDIMGGFSLKQEEHRFMVDGLVDYTVDNKSIFNSHNQQFYRSEEHTSELQSRFDLVCRLLLE